MITKFTTRNQQNEDKISAILLEQAMMLLNLKKKEEQELCNLIFGPDGLLHADPDAGLINADHGAEVHAPRRNSSIMVEQTFNTI